MHFLQMVRLADRASNTAPDEWSRLSLPLPPPWPRDSDTSRGNTSGSGVPFCSDWSQLHPLIWSVSRGGRAPRGRIPTGNGWWKLLRRPYLYDTRSGIIPDQWHVPGRKGSATTVCANSSLAEPGRGPQFSPKHVSGCILQGICLTLEIPSYIRYFFTHTKLSLATIRRPTTLNWWNMIFL